MIGREEGGGEVGKNENSIINTLFFPFYCSLLGLFRTKKIIRKRNGQVMNKRQMREVRFCKSRQIYIYRYVGSMPISSCLLKIRGMTIFSTSIFIVRDT